MKADPFEPTGIHGSPAGQPTGAMSRIEVVLRSRKMSLLASVPRTVRASVPVAPVSSTLMT